MRKILIITIIFLINNVYSQEFNIKKNNVLNLKFNNKENGLFSEENGLKSIVEINNLNNLVKKEFTVFIVFRSNNKKEETILDFDFGKTKFKVTSEKITKNKNLLSNFKNERKFKIVTFSCVDYKLPNRNELIINKDFNKDNNKILEILVFDKVLSKGIINQIETNLSLTHNISLDKQSNYYNFSNENLWKYDLNFQEYVSGIGLNKTNDFEKTSGINVEDLNNLNINTKSKLENNQYLIWGSNNEPIENLFSIKKGHNLKAWKLINNKGKLSCNLSFENLIFNKAEFKLQMQLFD